MDHIITDIFEKKLIQINSLQISFVVHLVRKYVVISTTLMIKDLHENTTKYN
jgi:hypothetical protein